MFIETWNRKLLVFTGLTTQLYKYNRISKRIKKHLLYAYFTQQFIHINLNDRRQQKSCRKQEKVWICLKTQFSSSSYCCSFSSLKHIKLIFIGLYIILRKKKCIKSFCVKSQPQIWWATLTLLVSLWVRNPCFTVVHSTHQTLNKKTSRKTFLQKWRWN